MGERERESVNSRLVSWGSRYIHTCHGGMTGLMMITCKCWVWILNSITLTPID